MKVKYLIKSLVEFDPELDIGIIYDGEHRIDLNVIYISKSNKVMVTDFDQVVYSDESKPIYYHSKNRYYYTEKSLKPKNDFKCKGCGNDKIECQIGARLDCCKSCWKPRY